MDLIYTSAARADLGVLSAYAFDLSFGAKENDFEIVLGADEPALDAGAVVYIEGTEYGGIVDGMKASTNGETVAFFGRTFHGILNSKVIAPDSGADYCTVSGDANAVLAALLSRLGLTSLFTAVSDAAGINIASYQFARYCKAYDGIRAMLAANGAKLRIAWQDRTVMLSAVPIADYTDAPIDGDIAAISVERHYSKVNHLVCLGKGELAAREVVHLYADNSGNIADSQYYTGLNEVAEIYENTSTEDLRTDGIKRFRELLDTDQAEMALDESSGYTYDIGDIVSGTERKSGVTIAAAVTQKIVKIQSGAISTEYKTGG